jgi:hypothetical protein
MALNITKVNEKTSNINQILDGFKKVEKVIVKSNKELKLLKKLEKKDSKNTDKNHLKKENLKKHKK